MKIPLSFLSGDVTTTTQRSGERQPSSCYECMATAEKDNIPKNMKLNVLLLGRDFKAFYCHANTRSGKHHAFVFVNTNCFQDTE